jgi:formate hydrogenlyase subunit 3/multisubunit Na+/H+ antiporter MnhD subunit
MTELLRVVEHVHGHVGWLAALALVHPAVLLRRRERRARLACALSTGAVTLTGALGAWLYPDYRARIKQGIFLHAPRIGWAFERKEHLALGAIVLAWAGLAAHLAATRTADRSVRHPLASAAHLAYVAAALLAVVASGLGLLVATYKTF